MRFFVTGGTGFFGKSMLDYRRRHPEWRGAQCEWVALSRNPGKFIAENPGLAKQEGVSFAEGDVREFAFPDGKFDAVLHAATSAVHSLPDAEMGSVILDGTQRVIEFARAKGVGRALYVSSGAVYGALGRPAKEDDECRPSSAYGKGKLAAENMFFRSGIPVSAARGFAFAGKYLPKDTHFAIGNFIADCEAGRDITIKGDGKAVRSYMAADDLAEWLWAILERGEAGRAYNVGSDEAVTIRELAERVCGTLGRGNRVLTLNEGSPGTGNYYVPDVTRAKTELGLKVKTNLDAILQSSAAEG